jgi:hypothetical protein
VSYSSRTAALRPASHTIRPAHSSQKFSAAERPRMQMLFARGSTACLCADSVTRTHIVCPQVIGLHH